MANRTLTAIVCACISVSVSAQSAIPNQTPDQSPRLTPRTHEERERKFEETHRIFLNVRVTDSSGQPVTGLGQNDFTLLEDQKEREIATFRSVGTDRIHTYNHAVLMLDAVNNSPRNVDQFRKDIDRFLHESREELAYPLAIGVLSEYGIRVGQASRDRDILSAQLKALTKEDFLWSCGNEVNPNESFLAVWMPGTPSTASSPKVADCLNRRFIRSITALSQFARAQSDVAGRMMLVWLGSGWPLLSSHEFRPDSVAFKRNNFHYLAELSTDMREGQITLYSVSEHDMFRIAEWRGGQDHPLFNGVPSEDQVTAGSFALQMLAHQSGGLILENSKDVARDISACIDDAGSYYALSFNGSTAEKPDVFHSIAVKVRQPGLAVRTGTVYYGEP